MVEVGGYQNPLITSSTTESIQQIIVVGNIGKALIVVLSLRIFFGLDKSVEEPIANRFVKHD